MTQLEVKNIENYVLKVDDSAIKQDKNLGFVVMMRIETKVIKEENKITQMLDEMNLETANHL